MHLQAVLSPGGDGALYHGHGEVVAQVLQAGDPPGYGQVSDVAEKKYLGFFSAETKRHFIGFK